MFLQNAKDLQIKQIAECFVTENIFDNIENEHANIEEEAEYDHIGNIESQDNHVNWIFFSPCKQHISTSFSKKNSTEKYMI